MKCKLLLVFLIGILTFSQSVDAKVTDLSDHETYLDSSVDGAFVADFNLIEVSRDFLVEIKYFADVDVGGSILIESQIALFEIIAQEGQEGYSELKIPWQEFAINNDNAKTIPTRQRLGFYKRFIGPGDYLAFVDFVTDLGKTTNHKSEPFID